MTDPNLVVVDRVQRRIVVIRGCRVMLDADLADLYEVDVRVLNQSVKRNVIRFPADFVFQPLRRRRLF